MQRVAPLFLLLKDLMSLMRRSSESHFCDGSSAFESGGPDRFQDPSLGRVLNWLHKKLFFFCHWMRDETQGGKSNITMNYFLKVNMRNLLFAFVASVTYFISG